MQVDLHNLRALGYSVVQLVGQTDMLSSSADAIYGHVTCLLDRAETIPVSPLLLRQGAYL